MNTKTQHWASIAAGILSLAGYASAASIGSEKYTYDASGNIVEKSIDGQVTQMTYDSSNRLTERQATGRSNETTAYDTAGRPIALKDGNGRQIRNMSYGYGDKVLTTTSQGDHAGFYYNAEGQLVGKKTSSGVSSYAWDGNVLAIDGAKAFTNEAHISGGVPLISSGTDVVISDYLGSTLASGENKYDGTAYGEGLEQGRFTGKSFVRELECFVFNHRLYSPETNRWTVPDPSGFPDGSNNLQYVEGNPISNIDPSGLYQQTAVEPFTLTLTNGTQTQSVILTLTTTYNSALGVSFSQPPALVSGQPGCGPVTEKPIPNYGSLKNPQTDVSYIKDYDITLWANWKLWNAQNQTHYSFYSALEKQKTGSTTYVEK